VVQEPGLAPVGSVVQEPGLAPNGSVVINNRCLRLTLTEDNFKDLTAGRCYLYLRFDKLEAISSYNLTSWKLSLTTI
jgi:hypothetical protein